MAKRIHVVAKSADAMTTEGPSASLAHWLLKTLRVWSNGARPDRKKQMRVVETLALGTKNKLVLVSCGGERFLVGTGAESVGTIVRVRAEAVGLAVAREQV